MPFDVVPSVVVIEAAAVVVSVVVVSRVVVVFENTVCVVSFGTGGGAGCAGALGPQFEMQWVDVQVWGFVLHWPSAVHYPYVD